MSHEPSEFTASTEPVYQAVSNPILFVWYRALIRRPTRSSLPVITAPVRARNERAEQRERAGGGSRVRLPAVDKIDKISYLGR